MLLGSGEVVKGDIHLVKVVWKTSTQKTVSMKKDGTEAEMKAWKSMAATME